MKPLVCPHIYDWGDASPGATWGSISWDWTCGLAVLARPNARFCLGVVGLASFWRCGFACLWVEYDQQLVAFFVGP
ncbi:hypothetical protein [Pyrobaculum ferrireducens]|uniref:Uncharacterized protein n=1 Tax=Pyrobaculum ferrireducens TaxID=1104324 RepID=G7VFC1_9CREN|nr:hypothetical protein [Pyrobaculum ferrireducens]AET32927.1 hypothetical protein P186_1508 [Pyrobaculum ferrireducens]